MLSSLDECHPFSDTSDVILWKTLTANEAWRFVAPGDQIAAERFGYDHFGTIVPPVGFTASTDGGRIRKTDNWLRSWRSSHDLWSFNPHLVEVVHYVKDPGLGKGQIMRTSLAKFIGTSTQIGLVVDHQKGLLPPDEVVHRAYSHVGHGSYLLGRANCEHMSTWCSTGHWFSSQVSAARGAGVIGSLFIPGGLIVVAAAMLGVLGMTEPAPTHQTCRICRVPHEWSAAVSGRADEIERSRIRAMQFEQSVAVEARPYL
ncbi:MAG: lecithin retinol acyltransferase family protein [Candidatus Nanopelagicales bacterium]